MKQVLIVDDRPLNREYLRTVLESSGYATLEADDGEEALKAVHRSMPDIVLADILMPRMDGCEFVRRLRSEPAIAATPVIFLTAHFVDREVRRLAEVCGVFHVITKPVEPQTVLEAVREALSVERGKQRFSASALQDFDAEHRRVFVDTLARKTNELETANSRLSALIALGSRIGLEHDVRQLLSGFCSAAGDMLQAKCTVIAIVDEHGSPLASRANLRHIIVNGTDSRVVGTVSAPGAANTLVHRYLGAIQPILVPDNSESLPQEHRGMGPALVVPIATSTRSYGLICFCGSPVAADGEPEVMQLAASMGSVLGVAYENALRYEQIKAHVAQLADEVASRRTAQEHVQRLNEELEQRVAERTQELESSHARLRQAERMASMGTLCTGLGHDMGNLLLPIRTRIDVLRRLPLADEGAQHIEAIAECVKYLQNLTDGLRLLALDPHDDACSGANHAITDLHDWLREVMPLLRSPLPGRIAIEARLPDGGNVGAGVAISSRLSAVGAKNSDNPVLSSESSPLATRNSELGTSTAAGPLGGAMGGPVTVAIGRHRLTQAVFNLVHNAAEAMRQRPEGRIVLSVEMDCEDCSASGRPMVRLVISDNGPGMSEDVRRRAMEPFFTTKKRELSTGLGLSLVHGIVTAVGGEMAIDSQPGRGTTVTLGLPLAEGNPQSTAYRVPSSESSPLGTRNSELAASRADGRRPGNSAVVTIADSRLRSLAASILHSRGYDVLTGPPTSSADAPPVVWVMRSDEVDVHDIERLLTACGTRVAVLGPMQEQWAALGAVHLGEDPRPSEFCARVGEMIGASSPARPATPISAVSGQRIESVVNPQPIP